MDKKNMTENFISHFKNMWADNGDYISKVYAGTGATTSSTTRKGKGGIMGMLDHKMKSIERFYKGHYIDNDKQRAIKTLLGEDFNIDLGTPENTIKKMEDMFTSLREISISILTWNCHIESSKINIDLISVLMRSIDLSEADIFVIGFQDVVKLNLLKLFSSDKKKVVDRWESSFKDYINGKYPDRFSRVTCDLSAGIFPF